MKPFLMSVLLKRTVLDTMSLSVRASNLEHAYDIAEQFTKDYPNNTKQFSKDVPFCVCENREDLDSETISIDPEELLSGKQ